LKIVVYSTIRDAYKKVFKPEGVDLIYKKGDQRFYRLEWRNNI